MESASIKRLRESARKLNSLGLVQFADQIVRWIDFVTGKNRSAATVKMFNQQTLVQLAQDIAKAEASAKAKAIEPTAVMSAIIATATTVESTGYSGSTAILDIIENATGISVGDKQDGSISREDLVNGQAEIDQKYMPPRPMPPEEPATDEAREAYAQKMNDYNQKIGKDWDAYKAAVEAHNAKVDAWNKAHPDDYIYPINITW